MLESLKEKTHRTLAEADGCEEIVHLVMHGGLFRYVNPLCNKLPPSFPNSTLNTAKPPKPSTLNPTKALNPEP